MQKYYLANHCGIKLIAPSKVIIAQIKEAIDILVKKHPVAFKLIKTINGIVVPNSRKTYDNMLFVKERIYVCDAGMIIESSAYYFSTLLAHEARHIQQYDSGKEYMGNKAEKDAYLYQRKYLAKVGTRDDVTWLDEQFEAQWWLSKKQNGEKTLSNPKRDNRLIKFVSDYLNDKLDIKI